MTKKKVDLLTGISSLLPEGLEESTLTQIAQLIAGKIDEEVKNQISDLTVKVTSFVRGNIEKLKEQAVKELELENPTFRNAQMFETVKALFAVENTADDDISGMGVLASMGESQENQINVLTTELDKLLRENVQLKRAGKVLSEQNDNLKGSLTSLKENVELVKQKAQVKKFSDSAVVVSEQNFRVKDNKDSEEKKATKSTHGNPWINENIVAAAKKIQKVG